VIEQSQNKGLVESHRLSPEDLIHKLPHGFWDQRENRRIFMDLIGKQLKFKELDDWYKITHNDIEEHGGSALINKYGGSRTKLLQSIYSEHLWDRNRFYSVPTNVSQNKELV
jgi:hypothetical protein